MYPLGMYAGREVSSPASRSTDCCCGARVSPLTTRTRSALGARRPMLVRCAGPAQHDDDRASGGRLIDVVRCIEHLRQPRPPFAADQPCADACDGVRCHGVALVIAAAEQPDALTMGSAPVHRREKAACSDAGLRNRRDREARGHP